MGTRLPLPPHMREGRANQPGPVTGGYMIECVGPFSILSTDTVAVNGVFTFGLIPGARLIAISVCGGVAAVGANATIACNWRADPASKTNQVLTLPSGSEFVVADTGVAAGDLASQEIAGTAGATLVAETVDPPSAAPYLTLVCTGDTEDTTGITALAIFQVTDHVNADPDDD